MTTDTSTLTSWLDWLSLDEDGRARSLRDLAEAMRHRGDALVADFLEEESARILATCAAHRAIVELHRNNEGDEPTGSCGTCTDGDYLGLIDTDWPCDTLRALVSVYADRPGFDARWVG